MGTYQKTRGRIETRQRLCMVLWLLLTLGTGAGFSTSAQEIHSLDEAQLKSAFLLNLSRFVYWPDSAFDTSDTFNLCFYRFNPYGRSTDTLNGRQVADHPVKVHIIDQEPAPGECHSLFIPTRYLANHPPGLHQPQLLTVSDLTTPESEKRYLGSTMISLLRSNTRIGFAVHREMAQAKDVNLSSELLKLGRLISHQGDGREP